MKVYLQMGPWQKNYHIFLLETPIEVKPTPTSLSRRALYVPIIFTMVLQTENDLTALAPNQPPSREKLFW